MTKLREVYKCELCGNVVEVLNEGIGTLVCCEQPMVLLTPKTEDQGNEKHVPVIEKTANGILVKVGEVSHPMVEKHFIRMIEVITADKVLRAELNPEEHPEAEFCVDPSAVVKVREYCTLHDLWENV